MLAVSFRTIFAHRLACLRRQAWTFGRGDGLAPSAARIKLANASATVGGKQFHSFKVSGGQKIDLRAALGV